MAAVANDSAVDYVASIAASGNSGNIVIAADPLYEYYVVRVSAKYAAEAATTGLAAVVSYSTDGTNYTALPSVPVDAPAVGAIGSVLVRVGSRNVIGAPLQDIKVVLTNNDATNAVLAVVDHLGHKE